ncbi:MAG: DUF2974 domain-containing protein [Mobilibacterium timonense]|uniref:Mbeg1-like protein n=1 Tax=Mobilibacterium timonense TaxID=1871012 RepID=UPI0023564838|nr:Mbeg1-like protein [Mobilibacterium timonense]MBM6991604.1 DUF2974 domain-containing protein [Mobilibacterium timonense]
MPDTHRNIIDYVRETNETFSQSPFNPVDSLVLSQLSYARLERVKDELDLQKTGVFGRSPAPRVKDFFRGEFFRRVFDDDISDESNLELFAFAAASPRFRDLQILNIEAEMDRDIEAQFGAMTFVLDDTTDYIAFRGTDGNLLGWKEDFNMSFMEEVPSQGMAVDYINRFFGEKDRRGRRRRVIIGGHSKGGNMAIYGGLKCDGGIHSRIIQIFSHDGPGFRSDVLEKLQEIQDRDNIYVRKLVPKASIIGMLMSDTGDYEVVDCQGVGIMQHYAFAWAVEGMDFVYCDGLSQAGEFNDRTIRDWLTSATYEERENFTETLYGLLVNNGINTLTDLKNLTPGKIVTIVASLGSVDEESRKNFFRIFRSLASASLRQLAPGDRRRTRDDRGDREDSDDHVNSERDGQIE